MARKKISNSPKQNYTPDELRDFAVIDERVDYASAMARADRLTDSSAIANYREAGELRQYARELAHKITAVLGHVALRQNDCYECSKCGATGRADALLNGAVFWEPCADYAERGASFGNETTVAQCMRRARYERGLGRELVVRNRAKHTGDSVLTDAHETTAKAYEALARDIAKRLVVEATEEGG